MLVESQKFEYNTQISVAHPFPAEALKDVYATVLMKLVSANIAVCVYKLHNKLKLWNLLCTHICHKCVLTHFIFRTEWLELLSVEYYQMNLPMECVLKWVIFKVLLTF